VNGTRGATVVEALAALVLAAIAAAGLAAAAATATFHVRLARERTAALGLALEALEVQRAGARGAGADAPVVDGTAFTRRWDAGASRGGAAALDAHVGWPRGGVGLATGAWP
jgi:Tfp pilus assembly protein PilV